MEENEAETDRRIDREGERESGNDTVRDREGIVRERETAWGEGGGRGVITLATLTRRRPDSRSRSTRSTRSTRLRLTYTPTLGLPLRLPPPLLVHPVPSRRPRRTSPPRRAPLRPPASLPFLRLPFLLVVFPVSTSASSTPCAARRGAARFIRVHSSIAEPESHQHQKGRTL